MFRIGIIPYTHTVPHTATYIHPKISQTKYPQKHHTGLTKMVWWPEFITIRWFFEPLTFYDLLLKHFEDKQREKNHEKRPIYDSTKYIYQMSMTLIRFYLHIPLFSSIMWVCVCVCCVCEHFVKSSPSLFDHLSNLTNRFTNVCIWHTFDTQKGYLRVSQFQWTGPIEKFGVEFSGKMWIKKCREEDFLSWPLQKENK